MGCDGDLEVIWTETYDNTSCPCEYTIYRTFDTSDCAGNPAMDVQTVVVEDTTPPELHNVPADVTYDLVSQIPLLDDALNGVSAIDNSGHATKTVIETDNGNGRFTRDFISEDCSGNTATDTQVITIIDVTPPSLPPIDDDTVECDEIPEPCNEYMQPIGETWNVEYAQEREDINDGQTLYRLIRTWYTEDDSSNSDTVVQTITVVDTTPPLLTRMPGNAVVECDCENLPVMPTVGAIDNCDLSVTLEQNQFKVNVASQFDYQIVWTWVARDDSDNSVSHDATITVQDTTAPEFAFYPADESVNCDENAAAGAHHNWARDNCDEGVNDNDVYSYDQLVIPSGDCDGNYTIVRTWETRDHSASRHEISHSQTITVSDNSAPVFVQPEKATCLAFSADGDFVEVGDIEDLFRANTNDDCTTDSADFVVDITACSTSQLSSAGSFSADCFSDDSSGAHKLYLRATRNDGNTDGRIYQVYATVSDSCGQGQSAVLNFWVPFNEEDATDGGYECLEANVASTYSP